MNADERTDFAIDLARRAGALAMQYYRRLDTITIESKGHHDLVSEADRRVERFVRSELARYFPQDGIVGEEQAPTAGQSDYVWVIDPIDGTANYVRGIPQWCVIIACCRRGIAEIGVIHEPVSNETFHAFKQGGTFLNGIAISASSAKSLADGVVGLDYCRHKDVANVLPLISGILGNGGAFYRSGSGGLNLAYVASGRLIGYVEEHMNAWDCVAGLLLIEEAGGEILQPDAQNVLQQGAVVVAAGKGVYGELYRICENPFSLLPR
ncbi:inositol monophosphatase [Agrobacterium vitis]|uniref:Inositol-1-monophosphatase n=2 Tax=Agrobacterium vitis TaxID=373 RepID=A0AAE4WGJ8_AGRVI|nr:inositol monophosphatase family protein [Agrobacterium vitis]MCF1500073.1 inositol monophosphatase [Allorhizobium sp. Av2]MCM2442242.1 inositol monophosphatase [Agrobacterium vitis]MUZ58652.1 inositol monophosphatase [Agrobacterium vitis]MVA66287.1 inositol monophosphatase [Agrobacterium vitis]MVA88324.1 inositol monophosphatase [Agrobacterium vitis]